jgi:tetratricopeptide (TPR) repeat protein
MKYPGVARGGAVSRFGVPVQPFIFLAFRRLASASQNGLTGFMIRQSDENAARNPEGFSPRTLLESIERHLSQTSRITDEKAHEAQQLVYDAWEAPSLREQQELIRRALKIDPDNVDALLQAASYAGVSGEQEIELLRKVVGIGEKHLGPKMFQKCAGAFWGFIETRPYMRARARLAEALRVAGRLDEAVTEYQAMLELNPNDNQAVRYSLLPCLLMLGRLDKVRKLFEQHPEEAKYSAVFAWGRVLELFLSRDLPAAATALAAARKQNPHAQAYVKGHRKPPRQVPECYSPGSREEAISFADVLRAAWEKHPAALQWLETQKGG